MKKKINCLILSVLFIFTCFPLNVFADDNSLPDVKLEVPEFKVPDNMPNASESLKEKYDSALEGLKSEGFGVNNFPNGLGELEPPPGFGSSLEKSPDAESLFIEKYGDMWKEKPLDKDFTSKISDDKKNAITEWEKSKPSSQKELTLKTLDLFEKMPKPELKNYISNLESKYQNMFKQTLAGETAYKNMKNAPSFQVTNKWADLMNTPDNIKKEYAFKTEQVKKDAISNRYLPEGYKEAKNTKLDDSPQGFGNFFKGAKNTFKSTLGNIKDIGKSKIGKKAKNPKEKDATKYEDTYNKYFYKGGKNTSKEQNKQRKQILNTFKKHGVYNRSDDWGKKSRNKQEMGKLIENNKNLLEKEIPGFKAFK